LGDAAVAIKGIAFVDPFAHRITQLFLVVCEIEIHTDTPINSFSGKIVALRGARNPYVHKRIAVCTAPGALHFIPEI